MIRVVIFLVCTIELCLFSVAYAKDIVYPGTERDTYQIRLLAHVLSYFPEKNYHPKAYGQIIPKARSFMLMASNSDIDVMMGGATPKRESQYLPIRFPILRGLNGWRIPLVQKGNEDLFANVSALEDFKRFVPGQFHAWSDTKILDSNGIVVEKGSNPEGLYHMLQSGRFDYFPRSVLEIFWDMKQHQHLDITIEPNILIHYPTAYYFYVSKENQSLAADIKVGLESALNDGSLETLFMQYYGEQITKVRQSKRRVFHLKNPFLSPETPLENKALWLDLTQ